METREPELCSAAVAELCSPLASIGCWDCFLLLALAAGPSGRTMVREQLFEKVLSVSFSLVSYMAFNYERGLTCCSILQSLQSKQRKISWNQKGVVDCNSQRHYFDPWPCYRESHLARGKSARLSQRQG